MGTYDIDLSHPQVLLYRRTELTGDGFPEPYPVIDEKVKTIRTPWNYDIGRGELQSIGQSFLYIDDDGIEDGKMDGFKLMIDCGNEIIPEEHVNRIKAWVEKGGVFVAYPFTGRSTPLEAESWPVSKLTGAKIKANEIVVRPGKVPKVAFPKDSAFFPSFAGQTIHGAKRRLFGNDFVLEKVSDDAEEILHWEDGRIAATARRVGKGMVVHLGSMFWRGSEDVKGMWNPQDEVERKFLRDLLTSSGHGPAMVETDDRLVLAQPYRTHNGLGLVGVFCNFNETNALNNVEAKGNPDMEVAISMRTGTKPRSLVSYGEDGIKDVPFEFADGVVKAKISLPMQEVKAVVADCYPLKDALSHWWKNSAEQWHEIKKLDIDFSKYEKGEWKDPTMDLKEGWSLAGESKAGFGNIPLDCIQFWGWPEKKGGKFVKTFDLDDASWMANGGTTRLVAGAWVGRNFLTPSTIRLNGEVLVENTNSSYLDFDVSKKIKEKGNVLEVELSDGEKFTGMLGNIYLYHREKPAMSVDALAKDGAVRVVKGEAGEDALVLSVPLEWKGKYRVRLYMEGKRNIPKGVRVGDRFMRKHHHNFGNITDIDITGLLSFGEENRIDIGANSPAEMPDKTSLAPVEILRFDLYPAK
jgi:hypothetical protein